MRKLLLGFIFFILFAANLLAQNEISIAIIDDKNKAIPKVEIYSFDGNEIGVTNKKGILEFSIFIKDSLDIILLKDGYETQNETLYPAKNKYEFNLELLSINLTEIEVEQTNEDVTYRKLNNIEGTAIYAGKKSEVIDVSKLIVNTATNNARQLYNSIAGLNIQENDGGGLQLSIGARGLDPNRTSNFNTRQNGYDISADALGYPESYYTPPAAAIKRIKIVRGAASLQYGPQFGGLLDFELKKGNTNTPLHVLTENTVGSFGLVNSFNSVGGATKKINYYAFYQRKQADGWRPNTNFFQNTAYARLEHQATEKLKIGIDFTHMDYLAKQPGGLVDFEFNQDPTQSKRARNWFKVIWNLASLNASYSFSNKTKIQTKFFVLDAERSSLGELGPINRPDPLRERDLLEGTYLNWGNETRFIHRYQLGNTKTVLLAGIRYYRGFSESKQGLASDGDDADFTFNNPRDLERFSYEFPSENRSFFIEHLFNFKDKLIITPGVRYEFISTNSDGYFKNRVISGTEVLLDQRIEDSKSSNRSIVLGGLGISYKINPTIEIYTNASQNYRSINFTDLAVANPNLLVDTLLNDESGFNLDLGIRGDALEMFRFDASIFLLKYNDRIGLTEIIVPDPAVIEKAVAYRTNIGNARILGVESYLEADIHSLWKEKYPNIKFTPFANLSIIDGEYTSGSSSVLGKKVELIPSQTIKVGAKAAIDNFKFSYQISHTGDQFTDATNAIQVADATRGIIPAFTVHDLSLSYTWKAFRLFGGVNNLTNESYFTRRATAYPGPGIIPADARSFYVGFRYEWLAKKK